MLDQKKNLRNHWKTLVHLVCLTTYFYKHAYCWGEVPDIDCLRDFAGSTYKGTRHQTSRSRKLSKSSDRCWKWSYVVHFANSHSKVQEIRPVYDQWKTNQRDVDPGLCRNPNNDPNGPWCFTFASITGGAEWNYCADIDICPYVVDMTCLGDERGFNFNGRRRKSRSGRECVGWSYMLQEFPDHKNIKNIINVVSGWTTYVRDYGLCRNPDLRREGPWCFVDYDNPDVMENCGIPYCQVPDISCLRDDRGFGYRGSQGIADNGEQCTSWKTCINKLNGLRHIPRSNKEVIRKVWTTSWGGRDSKACRNPDNDVSPWCFTTRECKKEYCKNRIHLCDFGSSVAHRKPSRQSSQGSSALAVDGNPGTCSQTDGTAKQWWMVNLLYFYFINGLRIRVGNGHLAKSIDVVVSRHEKYGQRVCLENAIVPGAGKHITIHCGKRYKAQYLKIQSNLDSGRIALCEVHVITDSEPFYPVTNAKPATTSDPSGRASLAVDGNVYTCIDLNSRQDRRHYWKVELLASYKVLGVKLTSMPQQGRY